MSTRKIRQERRIQVPDFRVERAKDENEGPVIVGHAALTNVKTDLYYCTESIAPGAFKESIERGDDVRALFNHDKNLILGRTPKTLELSEDEKGLFCRIFPPDTQLGRDLVISIERGDISQMSFGFYIESEIADFSKELEKPHFTITKVALFDVSPVTFPAYPTTDVEIERQLRSAEEEFKERLLRHGRSHGTSEAILRMRERELEILKISALMY